MGKSTISMAMFNSFLNVYQRVVFPELGEVPHRSATPPDLALAPGDASCRTLQRQFGGLHWRCNCPAGTADAALMRS